MEKKIYDFCFNYGYEVVYAFNEEGEYDFADIMQLSTSDVEPDDFWDECGEDAEWDYNAENAGMIAAFKEISGKTYKIWCDGYRKFAYTGAKKKIEEYNEKLNDRMDWSYVKLNF